MPFTFFSFLLIVASSLSHPELSVASSLRHSVSLPLFPSWRSVAQSLSHSVILPLFPSWRSVAQSLSHSSLFSQSLSLSLPGSQIVINSIANWFIDIQERYTGFESATIIKFIPNHQSGDLYVIPWGHKEHPELNLAADAKK